MGTKIQANTFFREYHSVIDLQGSTSNVVRPIYHENRILKNGLKNGCYVGYDREKVRQTIIEHESIFSNQLQELHRLYGRQRELMNEIKNDYLKDKCLPVFPEPPQDTRSLRTYHNFGFPSDVYSCNNETQMQERYFKFPGVENAFENTNPQAASDDRDTKLSLSAVQTSQRDEISANPCSSFNLVMKDFFQNSPSGEILSKSVLAEPRIELSHCQYTGTSLLSRRKENKIFGVEISEGNEYPFNASASNISSTWDPKTEHKSSSSWVANFCKQSTRELGGTNVNDGRNEKSTPADLIKGEMLNGKKVSLHADMIRDWLHGCSSIGLNFGNVPYQRTEGGNPLKCFENSDDMNSEPAGFLSNHENPTKIPSNTKTSSYFMNLESLQNYSETFFRKAEIAEGTFQTTLKPEKEISSAPNRLELVSERGGCSIDLNLSLNEEDAPSTPSLPTAIIKIATTEIDLEEAPAVIEPEPYANSSKTDVPDHGNSQVSYEECDKIAAEAITAISSSAAKQNSVDTSSNRLKWFADIISSDQSGPHDEEEPVPDGMDYFEFTTLKLEDVKREQHCYEPVVSENPGENGENGGTTLSKRSRRGRQRKDFQRDILPGLVTLSRLELAEDFKVFGELAKAEGGSRSLPRGLVMNGRGRKRLGGRNACPNTKVVCSGRAQLPVCQLEGRGLIMGWGKRTRRLSRQRCRDGFLAFPVKC